MRFLNPQTGSYDDRNSVPYDLTYDDVFMVPSRSAVGSRQGVDLSSNDGTGTTIPLVVANMTAIAGRRMAETVARRGGLVAIPQDIPTEVIADVIGWVKQRHLVHDTAITLEPGATVADALSLLPKRAHNALVVVEDGRPVGVVTDSDCHGVDRFTSLSEVMSRDLLLLEEGIDPRAAFEKLNEGHRKLAPVVDADGRLVGILTRKNALRATLYTPAVDAAGEAAGGRHRRHQRRCRGQGQGPDRGLRRRADRRHRARPPGVDDQRPARGPRAGPADPDRGFYNVVSAAGVRDLVVARTSSRSVSARVPCAPPG